MLLKIPKKLPSTLGDVADLLYAVDLELANAAKDLEKKTKPISDFRATLAQHAFTLLTEQKVNTAEGKTAKLSKSISISPTIEDWDLVEKFVMDKKNKASDLLIHKLNSTAVRERWESGVAIPGVGKFEKLSIKVKPRKGK